MAGTGVEKAFSNNSTYQYLFSFSLSRVSGNTVLGICMKGRGSLTYAHLHFWWYEHQNLTKCMKQRGGTQVENLDQIYAHQGVCPGCFVCNARPRSKNWSPYFLSPLKGVVAPLYETNILSILQLYPQPCFLEVPELQHVTAMSGGCFLPATTTENCSEAHVLCGTVKLQSARVASKPDRRD